MFLNTSPAVQTNTTKNHHQICLYYRPVRYKHEAGLHSLGTFTLSWRFTGNIIILFCQAAMQEEKVGGKYMWDGTFFAVPRMVPRRDTAAFSGWVHMTLIFFSVCSV